jgi:hypothetical protein
MSGDSSTPSLEPMNTANHFTAVMVADYQARRMNPAQILAFHDHRDACESCSKLLAHTTGFAAEDHLSEQDVVDFVTGLSPNPEIEDHLSLCAPCRALVEDLRQFQDESGPASDRTRRRRSPAVALFAAAAAVILVAGASVWITRPSAIFGSNGQSGLPLVSSLRDGAGVVGLTASGDLAGIDGLSASTRQLVQRALATGRIPAGPGAVPNTSPRGTLRSLQPSRSAFAILAPVAGSRELSDRPVFHWSALAGAETYEVAIFDVDLNEVARSGKLTQTEWQPPQPLPRQRSLIWQVAAQSHGNRTTAPRPPEPFPVFAIISADAARDIAAARAAAKPSHLVLAVLYGQQGLRKDAAEEMTKLAAENPGSTLIESLEGSLKGSPR